MSNRDPKYRRQRSSSGVRAFVELNGDRIYLGPFGSPESKQLYHQLLNEWNANGRQRAVAPEAITIAELVVLFWQHAKTYYLQPDGRPTSTLGNYRLALRSVRRLYGRTLAKDFGPLALKAVRQAMIDRKWSRGTINQAVNLIRGVFRWAVAEELITSPGADWSGERTRIRNMARTSRPIPKIPLRIRSDTMSAPIAPRATAGTLPNRSHRAVA